jgi:TDG/mug DNA glycosylase family protein
MGQRVETLADLLRPGLRAVVVGINPAPVSVAAGHYYQGRAGQRLLGRLRKARVIPDDDGGFEDDTAFAAGIGFTDIVKRPTGRAEDLTDADFTHGRRLIEAKLGKVGVPLVIFAFKRAATAIFGEFAGNGFVEGLTLAGADVFVMPGPYESSATADTTLTALTRRIA